MLREAKGRAAADEARRREELDQLSAMLAASSQHTADHSDDVVVIADALCEKLEIRGTERADLLAAARLHDIGKTSIPSEVIDKAGPLTDEEWDLMKGHTVAGERILSAIPELSEIGEIVRHSHERWDGAGYPDGLAGDAIPLASRVIFCADAFHAIRCDRPYRNGRPAADALAEVRRHSGTQFDPEVVNALIAVTRDLKLVPGRRGRGGPTTRLGALLMIVAVGATGTAGAELGLFGAGTSQAPEARQLEPVCGDGGCRAALAAPVADMVSKGGPAAGKDGDDGSRANGPQEADVRSTPPPASAPSSTGTSTSGVTTGENSPGPSSVQSENPAKPTESGAGGGGGNAPAADTGSGSGSSGSGGSGGGGSSGSTTPGNSGSNPHGGPPGQTGIHPQGGPPGQTGVHPQGGPPGQAKKD